MRFYARSLSRLAVAGALALSTLATAGISSASAAGRSQDAAHPYRHGIEYTVEYQRAHPINRPAQATSTNNLNYGGGVAGVGVTTGPPQVYIVLWGSQWGTQSTDANGYQVFSNDPNGMAPRLQAFFKGLGVNNELWSGVMTQYCQGIATGSQTCPSGSAQVGYPTGGALAGVWGDTASATPQQSSGHQLAQEAINAAGHFGNTTSTSNRNAQYFIVSPTGTNPDGFNTPTANWCAWHDYNGDSTLSGGGAVSSPYGNLAFANMPYVTDMGTSCGANFVNGGSAGTDDGVTIVGGHEYAETITDQFPAGGWTDSSGAENGDKCAWISSGQGASQNITLSTGTFAVQSTWANDFNSGSGGCEVSHPIVGATTNDFSISVSPSSASVSAGSSATYTVSSSITSGSAQSVSLSASGAPSGATVSFSPNPINSGSSSTMTVSTSSSTPAGTSTITITGTGSSATHTTSASLTVTAPVTNDFSISVSPSSGSVAAGSSTSAPISTAVTSGSAQSVSLSASGAPSGATVSFGPNPINSGSSSTMTVATSSSTAAGTYAITITGTGASATHTTSFSLTVTATSSGGVTNGGFETGTLAGWTSSGTTSVSSTAHSGSYSAMVGGSSPTNGDSSIAQTFSVPSGNATLSFWYRVVCPDTVTYDWATATLKDNTAGTTSTILGKTCSNTGAWTQVSTSVTAGHSVTLTLISHDDNYPGDPTYTLFDDVATSAPVAQPLVNGGFETGNLSGWTASGASTGVSTVAHSGSYSTRLGSTSPTNGDSTIAQTFTVPSGTSSLSFWYQVHCPDTVTYDWATATVRDNTAGTTKTVLSKTCTNNGAWVQVSTSVTAGHSVTITLTSHDDNYPGDPTYTLYDDVVVA